MLLSLLLVVCSFSYTLASCGCETNNLCCSKWGYCGTGADYCGDGCQGGPCWKTSSTPSTTPSTPPTTPSTSSGSGTVSSLISQTHFDAALKTCGVNKPNLYTDLVKGFTAPLPGGLNELALLMGNLAHESGSFVFTEEIKCAGVSSVTADCPYGWYHGRGYIQISWEANYKAAAAYLNNPLILSQPDIVMHDGAVNWQTVQWYWVTRVQDTFKKSGYTLGASVRAINGDVECNWGPISAGRITAIQCFQGAFGVTVDRNTQCSAAAQADQTNEFGGDVSSSQHVPGFVVAIIAIGTVTTVLVVVLVLLLVIGKPFTKKVETA